MSVNKVIILGRVGNAPESRVMPSGDQVCNFSVATSERYKDKSGELKEITEWHKIVIFGKLADIANKYVNKGSQVYIEGKLSTRKWKDKDGVDKYMTEIKADVLQMLDKKSDTEPTFKMDESKSKASDHLPDIPEDLPF